MPRDADQPRVEFLTPYDEQDEELAPVRPGPRRAPLALLAVAVVAVAVVLVVRAGSHHGRPSAAASSGPAGATSAAPVPVPVDPSVTPLPALDATAIQDAHGRCPRLVPTCVTTGEIPTEVAAAIAKAVPGARVTAGVSDIAYGTTSGPTLAFRRLSGRTDRLQIDVEIRALTPDDRPVAVQYDTRAPAETYVLRAAGPLVVRVAVTALIGAPVPSATVAGLAADPALLAIG